MHRRPPVLAAVLLLAAPALADVECGVPGVDLVVGDIVPPVLWGTLDGLTAYSFGSVICNVGDAEAEWDGLTPHHPVIAQQMYRVDALGVHPIAVSWVLHAPVPLQNLLCCPVCDPDPTFTSLGGGCSTPNTASTHGTQGGGSTSGLGPRGQVDPATGALVFPFTDSTEPLTVLRERMRVAVADLDPSLHPGARWFVEMSVVSAPDALSGHHGNNASVRELQVGAPANGQFPLFVSGATVRAVAMLEHWATLDPAVTVATIDVPGDGRLLVAARVVPLDGGAFRYEYAVENVSSARSVGGLTVPFGAGAAPTAFDFRDVTYHSGELFDGADWPAVIEGDEVAWRTVPHAENPNANAVRWGTAYAFALESARPPASDLVTLELFTPGAIVSESVVLPVPGAACVADLDGSGAVDFADALQLLAAWGTCGEPACPADLDASGAVDFADLLALLAAWGEC